MAQGFLAAGGAAGALNEGLLVPLYKTPIGDVLFIHVPKTGGTSVEAHLGAHFPVSLKGDRPDPAVPCKSQHYHGEVLERLLAGQPPAYAFMVVRHPVARVVSEFKFQSRKPWRLYRRLSFSRWLRRNLARAARDPYLRDNHFRPQVEFVAFGAEVFRLEDGLDHCFGRLQAVVGLTPPVQPPHALRSRPGEVPVSNDDLKLIREFYAADFERYRYPTSLIP